MKTNHQILSLLACILLLLNCTSEEAALPEEEEVVESKLVLKEVTNEIELINIIKRASFTTEGKIEMVMQGDIATGITDVQERAFTYSEDGRLECVTEHLFWPDECVPSITYTDGQITSLNGHPITYDGNTIIESYIVQNAETRYVFEDTTFQKLLKVETWLNISSGGFLIDYETFTYEGDNLKTAEKTIFNDATGVYEVFLSIEHIYDNRPNPFQQAHDSNALISYHHPLLNFFSNRDYLIQRSANNVLKSTSTSSSGAVGILLYGYIYNAKGYPVERIRFTNGYTDVVKYEYYDELE